MQRTHTFGAGKICGTVHPLFLVTALAYTVQRRAIYHTLGLESEYIEEIHNLMLSLDNAISFRNRMSLREFCCPHGPRCISDWRASFRSLIVFNIEGNLAQSNSRIGNVRR